MNANQKSINANQKQRSVRYRSRATARIPNVLEDQGIIKNISSIGCCLEYAKPVSLKMHDTYILHVFPETESQTTKFELLVESRWIRLSGNSCEVGFWIISSPTLFSRYRHWCVRSK